MAEVVNERIEEMLTELEQMKRIELYTQEEIKEVSKRRKEFEYKIQRKIRCKEDFLRYIGYECLLLHDIRLRRERYMITEKKHDIEYMISKRVSKLYKELIARFPSDLEIWLSFIKFCKRTNLLGVVTSYMEKLLQIHGDKPKIWQLAGRWQYEEVHDVDNARKIIMKGIHRNPKCEDLYIDLFRIELLVAEAVEDEAREKQLKRADVVIDNALDEVDRAGFIVKLCNIANDFSFTSGIKLRLFTYLWDNHSGDIETWNFIASCELEGKDVTGFNWKIMNNDSYASKYPENFANFVSVYETALLQNNAKKPCMNYINAAIKMSTNESYDNVVKFQILNQALSKGHTLRELTEDHYRLWLNLMCLGNEMDRDEISNILERACINLPSSQFIWLERLKRCTDNSKELFSVFKSAKSALTTESVAEVWSYVIDSLRDVDTLKRMFLESMTLPPTVASVIKPIFLKAFHTYGDIVSTRQQYLTMANSPPIIPELHSAMIEIEQTQDKIDVKSLRNCYELAIQQFGTKYPDIWLSYIKFETEQGKPERCGMIYKRGCSSLDHAFVDEFISKHSLIKCHAF